MSRVGFAAGRAMVLIAAVLFTITLVAGLLPIHARLVVYSPEGKRVSCGSAFLPSSSYGGDDACERRLLGRYGWVVVPGLAAVLIGAFGLAIVNDTYKKV